MATDGSHVRKVAPSTALPGDTTQVIGGRIPVTKIRVRQSNRKAHSKTGLCTGRSHSSTPSSRAESSVLFAARLMARALHECFYHQTYKDRQIQLLLHPLALVHTDVQLYLVAVTDGHEDVRLYALHRCKQATLTDQPSQIPADFELQSFLDSGAMQFKTGALIDFQAHVSAKLAAILRETTLTTEMKLDLVSMKTQATDEKYLLTAQIHDSWHFQLWLMSQGRYIEVLAPESLRQQIQQELIETLAYYQPRPHANRWK